MRGLSLALCVCVLFALLTADTSYAFQPRRSSAAADRMPAYNGAVKFTSPNQALELEPTPLEPNPPADPTRKEIRQWYRERPRFPVEVIQILQAKYNGVIKPWVASMPDPNSYTEEWRYLVDLAIWIGEGREILDGNTWNYVVKPLLDDWRAAREEWKDNDPRL